MYSRSDEYVRGVEARCEYESQGGGGGGDKVSVLGDTAYEASVKVYKRARYSRYAHDISRKAQGPQAAVSGYDRFGADSPATRGIRWE